MVTLTTDTHSLRITYWALRAATRTSEPFSGRRPGSSAARTRKNSAFSRGEIRISPCSPSSMLSRSRESAGEARGLCVDRTLCTSPTEKARYSHRIRPHCTLIVLPSTMYRIGMNAMKRSASTNVSTQNETGGPVPRLIHSFAIPKAGIPNAKSTSHQSILDRNTRRGTTLVLCPNRDPRSSHSTG